MNQEAFFTSPLAGYLTLRDMAAKLGVSIERVLRVVETRRISHAKRVGVVRLWDEVAFREIAAAVAERK